ncbi:Flagellar hook-associated protein 2 [Pseudobythopirellula maris]|uniref:Filament cap protein n=1 Tax=Pseudobythopirellula maris TaxID=2527991 RepID=A0A5C5ZP48_9BACT|nr:flagellar filament capping protein FliD [Pseudobythopirellula maris]TWT88213.1 Flagellar hook-associated protein 2 [Pseudobythopirellula maris]
MSGIQTNVGLITGIPIQETVDQLLAVSAQPKNLLTSRAADRRGEQAAVDRLSSLVLGMRFSLTKLGRDSTYTARAAASSDPTAIKASVVSGESPKVGSYQLTPLRTASSHQLVSGSYSDLTGALGEGSLSFRFGGHVDKGVALSELNGGEGFTPGKLKITDRSGATGVIDLRGAITIDDVISAVNSSEEINVRASADGDQLVLNDLTGESGNFRVQEVGSGTTAASLGLAGLNAASDTLTGSDVYALHDGMTLASLRDGAGVRVTDKQGDGDEAADLFFTFAESETEYSFDLTGLKTLGDVVDAINSDETLDGKVTAAISADGARLELTDNTAGAESFTVRSADGGSAAEDLGLAGAADAGVITGERLVSGLKDTLVSSLNGGKGYSLGELAITDRSGAADTVDLSSAETLGEVVSLINASSADVTAAINASRNGIQITDGSGGVGNLVIADSGATTTATDLGLAVDDSVGSVGSGSLDRRVVSGATLLSSLNGGDGLELDDFKITDSTGKAVNVDLDGYDEGELKTLGDVIDAINADLSSSGSGVVASFNDAGDGVLLTDTSSGAGTLTVVESGGSTAAGLKLLGESSATNEAGDQIIDGSTSHSVDLTDLEGTAEAISLSSLNSGSGVQPGIFQVTDSYGKSFTVDLGFPGEEAFTVGDVIEKINTAAQAKGSVARAEINSAGTGIAISETNGGGSGTLTVADLGTGSAAADLNLARESSSTTTDGEQTINSGFLFNSTDAEQGALETVAERINDLEAGLSASVVFDGVGYRLALSSDKTGAANEILLDSSSSGLSFTETSRAADAAALFGPAGGGFVVTSENNQFNDVVSGLNLTVGQATGEAVTVTVSANNAPIVDAAQDFVDSYNSLRTELESVTDFDSETLSTGILFGTNEALRVDSELSRLVSGRFFTSSEFGSLEEIGISLDDEGRLSLNSEQLTEAFESDPGSLEAIFNDDNGGVVAKLQDAADRLAGDENSLLAVRSQTLTTTIEDFENRIAEFDAKLERERDRLLLEFYTLEETIALMQADLETLSSFESVAPLSYS